MGAECIDLWPRLLTCRQIDALDAQLLSALGLDPQRHRCAGLVTCDQDDALFVALDHATKFAHVDVVLARSFYAGSKHASGPLSGESLGVLAGATPEDISEGLHALRAALLQVRFQTFSGDVTGGAGQPAFLAHVIEQLGRHLAQEASLPVGAPMAYLIAPPAEALVAVDAALKAAQVRLAKWIPAPSETNFSGAFLTGALDAVQAARDAFVEAVYDVSRAPLLAARRPFRERH